jgi:CheY-like chemotaxis protein
VSETVDLRTPEEMARLRHSLRTALNNLIGYADMVRRQAEEQGARAESGLMTQIAAAGREGMEIVLHLLPVKSHVSESALPMLRANLGTRVERIRTALARFESGSRGSCAAETGKMRDSLRDLAEFVEGVDRARPAPAPIADSARTILRGTGRILIVDGDDASSGALFRLLESAGLTPVAETRSAALERLRREPFELVLLDASYGDVLDAVDANPQLSGIPVVVLASQEQSEAAARALENGAEDVIGKPVDAVLARARIGKVLRRLKA